METHPEFEVKEPLPKQCICMWADKVVLLLREGKIHTTLLVEHGTMVRKMFFCLYDYNTEGVTSRIASQAPTEPTK